MKRVRCDGGGEVNVGVAELIQACDDERKN